MKNCPKCGGSDAAVAYEPRGAQRPYKRSIDGVSKFMRADTYYVYDEVVTEHLIYTCKTCGYMKADHCKDKEGA